MTHAEWLTEARKDQSKKELLRFDSLLRKGIGKVEIVNIEYEAVGLKWAINVCGTVFWMQAFNTKSKCVALCQECGWQIA